MFFYLYLIVDIFSRKIVGWEVYGRESAECASTVVRRAVWAESCLTSPLVLHADNGSPMKGATLKVTLEHLGVTASYNRPRVRNDNPFSEALFRACKYRPEWPPKGFSDIEAARDWVKRFADWYNGEHLHSGIRFVAPNTRHAGHDQTVTKVQGWTTDPDTGGITATVSVHRPAVPGRPDPHSDRPFRMAGAARCLGVA